MNIRLASRNVTFIHLSVCTVLSVLYSNSPDVVSRKVKDMFLID